MKKSKILLAVFMGMMSLVIVFSCHKDETNALLKQNTNSVNINDEISENGWCEFGFSNTEITNIGLNHNHWLKNIMTNFDHTNLNKALELNNGLMNLNNGLSSNIKSLSISYYENCLSNDNNLALKITNPIALNILNKIFHAIDTVQHLDNLNTFLNALIVETNITLSCLDREIVLISIEVCRNSAMLWFPIEMGGENYYDTAFRNNSNRAPKWLRNLVRNDVAGAAWACFELAGALALGAVPGTNVAIGGAIVSSAVGGSVMGALFP